MCDAWPFSWEKTCQWDDVTQVYVVYVLQAWCVLSTGVLKEILIVVFIIFSTFTSGTGWWFLLAWRNHLSIDGIDIKESHIAKKKSNSSLIRTLQQLKPMIPTWAQNSCHSKATLCVFHRSNSNYLKLVAYQEPQVPENPGQTMPEKRPASQDPQSLKTRRDARPQKSTNKIQRSLPSITARDSQAMDSKASWQRHLPEPGPQMVLLQQLPGASWSFLEFLEFLPKK